MKAFLPEFITTRPVQKSDLMTRQKIKSKNLALAHPNSQGEMPEVLSGRTDRPSFLELKRVHAPRFPENGAPVE